MSLHTSLYRRLLLAFPAAFRDDYADELAGLFEDLLADARRSSRFALLRLWMSTLLDLMTSATRERMEDAMNTHPVITRALLIAVPVATVAGLSFMGPAVAISVLAVGTVLVALAWRSVMSSFHGPAPSRWWFVPLLGIALVGVAVGITQLPGPGDLVWGLASLVALIGVVTALVSVLFSLIAWTRRPAAPSAS